MREMAIIFISALSTQLYEATEAIACAKGLREDLRKLKQTKAPL